MIVECLSLPLIKNFKASTLRLKNSYGLQVKGHCRESMSAN